MPYLLAHDVGMDRGAVIRPTTDADVIATVSRPNLVHYPQMSLTASGPESYISLVDTNV